MSATISWMSWWLPISFPHAFVTRSGLRLREDNYDVGDRTVRYPELAAIEHPVVAVALCSELDSGWVRANVRLGQSERSDSASRKQVWKVGLPLLLRPEGITRCSDEP